MEIGTIIRNARELIGSTQREVAIKADVTAEYISKIERGEMTNIGLETLRRIAGALNLSITELASSLEAEGN